MSGAYGIYTSPVRTVKRKTVIGDTQEVPLGINGAPALSISVKQSKRVGRHFKSNTVQARQVGARPLLQTLTQRGIDTSSRVSLDLDPRNFDGNPVVARAFTQSLNTRPYTKDQRTQQLRAMLVKQNPNTLHQPESFHVHSFFESAAPGFSVGSASVRQLAPPHSGKQRPSSANSSPVGIPTSSSSVTLSKIYEDYTAAKRRNKSLGAEWPIGPTVEDARLRSAYDFRKVRKRAVPLAPLDPALPSVEEMPPVPQDSFFLLSNTNKLLPTAGFETFDGSGVRRRMSKRREGARGGPQSTMSTTLPSPDITLAAPLMSTRRLFGKTQLIDDNGLIQDQSSMLNELSTSLNESTELLNFGDEQLEIPKQRPNTAPLIGGTGGTRLPGQMRMTVVVRQEKSRKKKRRNKNGVDMDNNNQVDIDNHYQEKDANPDMDTRNNNQQIYKRQEALRLESPLPLAKHPLDCLKIWTTIPICIIATEDCQAGRELFNTEVLPKLNRALLTRYVQVVLVGAGSENLVDMLQLIEFCGDNCIVLYGETYGKSLSGVAMDDAVRADLKRRGCDGALDKGLSSFDVQVRYALTLVKGAKMVEKVQTKNHGEGSGALCCIKSRDSHQPHDRETALESLCRSSTAMGHVSEYMSDSPFNEYLGLVLETRLQKRFPVKSEISWFEKERMYHALFRQQQMAHGDGVPGLLEGVAESVKLNTGMSPVIVLGSQGIGKSHSMACLADFIEDAGEEWVLISHFVGASTASRKLCATLARMCVELIEIDQVVSRGLTKEEMLNLVTCQNYPSLCSLFRVSFNRGKYELVSQFFDLT